METVLAFGILWVIFACLIVILHDKWAAVALLALNLTIAAFLLAENDLMGAVLKAVLGVLPPVIILLAAGRTNEPAPRFNVRTLIVGTVLTVALSSLIAFLVHSQFSVEQSTETYILFVLFGVAFLVISSQRSILKLLLGILILENIGTLLLASGTGTALFAGITEIFVVLITFIIALVAVIDYSEYGTVDSSKLIKLRG
ncbi:MAG: hypothetical protein ACXV5H_09345 [Halobacteriota archaeon]